MFKFLKKLKNNKGGADGVMFISGMLLLTVVVIFSMNIFDLTWQRYVVKRELGNVSRLYAIRWTEMYLKTNCNGNFATCSTNVKNSKLGKEIEKMMQTTIDQGNLDNATLVISRNPGDTCASAGVLLCVYADEGGNVSISGQDWSVAKSIGYGDVLYSSIQVEYSWSRTLRTQQHQEGYTLTNKFASERHASESNLIGS